MFLIAACATPATPLPDLPSDAPAIGSTLLSIDLAAHALILRDDPIAPARSVIPLTIDCLPVTILPAPRGSWIALETSCDSIPVSVAINLATQETFPLTSDPSIDSHILAWHPNGRYLYAKIGMLATPQIEQIDITQLSTFHSAHLPISAFTYDLTIAPNGEAILYSFSQGIGYGSETTLSNIDGSNIRLFLKDEYSIIAFARYAPNGSQIAYILMPDSTEMYPQGELWIVDADGSHARSVAVADAGHGYAPSWSPDGTKIAFVGRETDEQGNIFNEMIVYDLIRDAAQAITDFSDAQIESPVWSSDGAWLIFNVIRNDTMQLWAYNTSNDELAPIDDTEWHCCAAWLGGR